MVTAVLVTGTNRSVSCRKAVLNNTNSMGSFIWVSWKVLGRNAWEACSSERWVKNKWHIAGS